MLSPLATQDLKLVYLASVGGLMQVPSRFSACHLIIIFILTLVLSGSQGVHGMQSSHSAPVTSKEEMSHLF